MDQNNVLSSEDELLDDMHLQAKIQSDRDLKMPYVTQSQFNLHFQHPQY